ncbi:MAG: hypothetical protein H0U49_02860, partial [Parachlamydiaceae bacterium]|nr:hypothetical protein [Parachlamydiaceae bacterium]
MQTTSKVSFDNKGSPKIFFPEDTSLEIKHISPRSNSRVKNDNSNSPISPGFFHASLQNPQPGGVDTSTDLLTISSFDVPLEIQKDNIQSLFQEATGTSKDKTPNSFNRRRSQENTKNSVAISARKKFSCSDPEINNNSILDNSVKKRASSTNERKLPDAYPNTSVELSAKSAPNLHILNTHNRKIESKIPRKNIARHKNDERLKLDLDRLEEKVSAPMIIESSPWKDGMTFPISSTRQIKCSPRKEPSASSPTSSMLSSHSCPISGRAQDSSPIRMRSPETLPRLSPAENPSPRKNHGLDSIFKKQCSESSPIISSGHSSPTSDNIRDSSPLRKRSPESSPRTSLFPSGMFSSKRRTSREEATKLRSKETADEKELFFIEEKDPTSNVIKRKHGLSTDYIAIHNSFLLGDINSYNSMDVFTLGEKFVISPRSKNIELEIDEEGENKIFSELKRSLINDEDKTLYPSVNEIFFDICFKVLKSSFFKHKMTIRDYEENEKKCLLQLLGVLQKGGSFLKRRLARLLLLQKNFYKLSGNAKPTNSLVKLGIYLYDLTELESFTEEVDGFLIGKRISSFLAVFRKMFNDFKDPQDSILSMLHLNSNSKSLHPIEELLLLAIGGSVEEGYKFLHDLKFWSEENKKSIKMLEKYCNETTSHFNEVQSLLQGRHHCFIEHVCPNDQLGAIEKKNLCTDSEGNTLFLISYASHPCTDVCRSLKPDAPDIFSYVNPYKITVNGEDVYLENPLLEVNPETDPFPTFWVDLIAAFYKHGYAGVNCALTREAFQIQADALIKFYFKEIYSKEFSYEKSIEISQDIYERIPSLKILELMSIKCGQVVDRYICYLFPQL